MPATHKQPAKLTPQQIRQMNLWNMQMVAAFKKAIRNPGVMTTVTLDMSDTSECVVEILAREQVKLILPIDDD